MSRVEGGAPVRPQVITDPVRPGGGDVPIEPVGTPDTPKPFSPGVGTWLGAGVGGAIGGVVGLGIGGLVGLAAAPSGGALGGVIAVGLGVAGLVGGGIAAYNIAKGSHESSEHKRVQDAFGTSTLQNAREFMTRFDHDGDGQVDLVNRTGLPGQDETMFLEKRDQSSSELDYDWWDDDWDVETTRWTESRGVSALDVWEAANTSPKDQVVTDTELAHLMARHDADRNGALNSAEQEAFRQAHPLVMDDWRR